MPIRLCLFFHYWALIARDGTWRFLQNYINFRKRLSRKELLTPKIYILYRILQILHQDDQDETMCTSYFQFW